MKTDGAAGVKPAGPPAMRLDNAVSTSEENHRQTRGDLVVFGATMNEYRVNLDLYNGPLDLLLYLIRRDEVDIYDIPIASVTQQYVAHVEMLQELDPNLAGEFLVLAATLLEIKTRMLLPTPPPEEGGAEGLEIDPRAELVRQLLEYKAFKDAAGDLGEAASRQAMMFPRAVPAQAGADEGVDIEEVQVWDLLNAFGRILEAIGQDKLQHEVIYDDTPLELHADDILDRLRREGPMTFARIFEGRTRRSEIVGLFLAMLELVRRKQVVTSQDRPFGDIHIHINTARQAAAGQEDRPGGEPAAQVGEYASEPPGDGQPPGESKDNGDDDDRGQDQGARV